MVLSDTFCTYRGEKYRTYDAYDNGLEGGELRTWICTDNTDLTDETFTETEYGGWEKTVDPWDLENVYKIEAYGIYRGHRVLIRGGDDRLQTYVICSGDETLAREWGMDDPPGLGEGYEKEVPWEEVELVWTREKWYWKGKYWLPLGSINLSDLSLAVEPMRRWIDGKLLEEMRKAMENRSVEEREKMILALEKMWEEKGRQLTAEDLPEVRKRLGIG